MTHTVMVTSRLLLLLLGCRGDLHDVTSPAVPVDTSVVVLDGDERTIAPPFLGADDPADLVLLLMVVVVVVMRDAGDLADGDVSLSVGDSDDVTATASCRKIRSLRRRYHSSV